MCARWSATWRNNSCANPTRHIAGPTSIHSPGPAPSRTGTPSRCGAPRPMNLAEAILMQLIVSIQSAECKMQNVKPMGGSWFPCACKSRSRLSMNRPFARGSALTLTLSPRRGNSYRTASTVRSAALPHPAPNDSPFPLNGVRGETGLRRTKIEPVHDCNARATAGGGFP